MGNTMASIVKDRKGYTLVELLVTVAVIGILAMIAIPLYLGQQRKAAFSEAQSNLMALRLLEEQYFAENGCYWAEGNPLACTNKVFPTVDDIKNAFPGFKPGISGNLLFTYQLNVEADANGNAAGRFRAIATGKTTAIVKGSVFSINDRNEKSW